MNLPIRAASADDVAAVLQLWREAAQPTSTDTEAAVSALVAHDPGALMVAEGSGRIVGTVIAGFDGWRCHLYRLAVAPDRRRRGIGTALLDAAHRRFESFGGRRADAMVLERNETGQRTWIAAGYQREDHWRRWVKPLR